MQVLQPICTATAIISCPHTHTHTTFIVDALAKRLNLLWHEPCDLSFLVVSIPAVNHHFMCIRKTGVTSELAMIDMWFKSFNFSDICQHLVNIILLFMLFKLVMYILHKIICSSSNF